MGGVPVRKSLTNAPGMVGAPDVPTTPSNVNINMNMNMNMNMNAGFGQPGIADPFAAHGDDPTTAFNAPFMPSNSQNALAAGSFLYEAPTQYGNLMQTGNAWNTAGSTTMGSTTMLNTTMSSPSPTNNTGGGVNHAMTQQAMGQVVDAMGKMQQQMAQMTQVQAQMQEMVIDQRNYIEQRDSWLETRMSHLDRRCQKVEVLSDRLNTLLRGFDVEGLSAVPGEVAKALDAHLGSFSLPSSPDSASRTPLAALRDQADSSDDPYASQPSVRMTPDSRDVFRTTGDTWGESGGPGPSSPQRAMVHHGHDHHQHHTSPVNHAHSEKVQQDMKRMSQQLDVLVSSAEATPQMTRLLWRMDLNLRQVVGTASNLPKEESAPVSPDRSKPARQRFGAGSVQGNRSPSKGGHSGLGGISEDGD